MVLKLNGLHCLHQLDGTCRVQIAAHMQHPFAEPPNLHTWGSRVPSDSQPVSEGSFPADPSRKMVPTTIL